MIPYFEQPVLHLGPLSIHAFGALVVTGILIAIEIIRRRAPKVGLDADYLVRLATWILVAGFVGAHLVDRLIYKPGETLADPLSLLQIWKGISSFGGFLGAVVGLLLFFRKNPPPGDRLWQCLDLIAYGFSFAWVFGRMGCFVAYDHPGVATSFFLGQMYSDGQVRFNLGLLEALYFVPLAALFFLVGRKPRKPGLFVGLMAVLYVPFRFFADFLRIQDVRYAGLTPAQYASMLILAVGVIILWRVATDRTAPPEPVRPPPRRKHR